MSFWLLNIVKEFFGPSIATELISYWRLVAKKGDFTIDRATVLPDHIHLMIRIVPKVSIATCVLALMNNGQHWLGKHYPHLLIKAKVVQLWQPSAYVGTTGRITTALVKSFLNRDL